MPVTLVQRREPVRQVAANPTRASPLRFWPAADIRGCHLLGDPVAEDADSTRGKVGMCRSLDGIGTLQSLFTAA